MHRRTHETELHYMLVVALKIHLPTEVYILQMYLKCLVYDILWKLYKTYHSWTADISIHF